MSTLVQLVVATAYLSILLELVFLHVPSVASNLSLLSPRAEITANLSPRYRKLFRYSTMRKIVLLALPLAIISAVFLFPLFVIRSNTNPLNDHVFEPGAIGQCAAIVLLFLGRAITLLATMTIRSNNRQQDESFFLHTTGLFKLSRNPGLVGMFLFVAGLWLLVPSASLAAGSVVYVLYMNFKVRLEEDFLLHKFGAPYSGYRAQTRRYL